ncbi:MAG: helix-turn-helix domain-containing protein [Alphaproteobacteria bacterium]|nr:helix-turn-helix domain-containing protein [Alphaproteobacteria bacterium]
MSIARTEVTGQKTGGAIVVEPKALRINDAVQILGLSRSTLYKLFSEEKIRLIKIGGRRLVPMAEITRLLCEESVDDR